MLVVGLDPKKAFVRKGRVADAIVHVTKAPLNGNRRIGSHGHAAKDAAMPLLLPVAVGG